MKAEPVAQSPRPSTQLALVVVNYGSSGLLAVHLLALHRELDGAIVVVVDNPTDDAERRAATTLCEEHGWHLVTPSTNVGFGVGVNVGVERAEQLGAGEVLVINPDASIDAASVAVLRDELAARPDTLAAPRILRPDGSTWSVGHQMSLADGTMRRCPGLRADPGHRPWITGAVMIFGMPLWQRIGGFDDRYFLYWEDVDLSHRVLDAGGRLVVCEEAVAIHDEGGTQQAGHGRALSAIYYYYNIRNRLLYAAIHLDRQQRSRWSSSALRTAREVLLRGGKRQFRHPVAPVGAALRGLRDGRRLLRTVGD